MTKPAEPKRLDRLRDKLRLKPYAWKTEGGYLAWVERFLRAMTSERFGNCSATSE